MSKRVKYFSFAIAIIAVAAVMTIAIYAATSASAGITANVSWTATEGIAFELEGWVVNNPAGNGIGNTSTPKSITKQIVTASTSNSTAQNLAGDLACGFYDGSDDGVNNPSNIIFTYKIKNTGSGVLKVTVTKTPTNSAESGTTAENHKPAVALSSKLEGSDNTSSCISSLTGSGYNIASGKTLEYIVTLSISNADLSITSFDAGVTFSFGVVQQATASIYVNGVQQTNVASASTVGDYLDALDGSQYPGYFYDEDLTIYAGEDDIVTNDTKLYTKEATLDKLTFTSNGDGTCSVKAGDGTSVNSFNNNSSDNIKVSIEIPGFSQSTVSGEVVIPLVSPAGDGVTSIGYLAFMHCTGLTSIVIPDSVINIEESAFNFCSGLTSIVIPDSVTSIGKYAFQSCGDLTSIVIPDDVTSIGNNAFSSCSGLTSIVIPDSVTSIGSSAFSSCYGLTSIYIPSSVTTISASSATYSPFYSCSSSLKIYCGASSKPSGWASYWNYRTDSATYTPTWGVTREQYNSLYA